MTTDVTPLTPPRAVIGGVPVDLCSAADFVRLTTRWATDGGRRTVIGVNAHVVNVAATDPAFAAALAASDLNLPDGQSIVWAARLLGHRVPERVPLTHLTSELCAAWAAADLPVYLLGGRPGVAARAAERLRQMYGTRVVGATAGYFDDDDPAIVPAINASGAQIVLVGLGNPRQELWTHAHRAELAAGVVLTCGGWLDWTAGVRRRCPRWIYALGLEWAYRLAQEPRRLFRRYVTGNPVFAWRVARRFRADRASATAVFEAADDQR